MRHRRVDALSRVMVSPVTKLNRLMGARRRSRGNYGAAKTALREDFGFDRRVSPGVEHLSRVDSLDCRVAHSFQLNAGPPS